MANTQIQSEQIADDAVTGSKIENAVTIATSVTSPLVDGQNFKINGGQGSDGQLLTSTGSGVAWEDASGGVAGISSSADATAITIGSDESVTFSAGITSTQPNAFGACSFNDADLSDVGTIFADQYLGDADTNTGIVLNGSDVMTLHTAGTERLRINASGQIGIACTDQSNLLTVDANSASTTTDSISVRNRGVTSAGHTTGLRFQFGTAVSSAVRSKLTNTSNGEGTLSFYTSSDGTAGNLAERWRIDSSGRMTNAFDATGSILQVAGNSVGGGVVGILDPDVSVSTGNVILQLTFSVDQDATSGKFAQFSDGNHNCGSISAASGTSVSYNTSSDERLKKNIVDVSSQLNVIKNIKVREFDWKKNGYHEVGMIAQELNTLVPSAVQEGGDDEMEMPWSVDYAKLTPYLIKAVQEQQTVIEALTARITTLEG